MLVSVGPHALAALLLGKNNWMGGSVDPKMGVDFVENCIYNFSSVNLAWNISETVDGSAESYSSLYWVIKSRLSSASSSSMALQSNADLLLLNGLLPSQPRFLPLFSNFNFALINMFVRNATICFLVVLLVDFPEVYCQTRGLPFSYYPFC